MKQKIHHSRPSAALLEAELQWMDARAQHRMLVISIVCVLMTFAVTLFLAATLWFPVIRIHGNSMMPTLSNGDILLCVKTHNLETGDISVFYHNNKILVKRVIGCEGDQIDLEADGKVRRNGILLAESYIETPAAGIADITFPCQVPAGSFFMMGDHRISSLDSRSSAIGFVPEERILGKAILRIWPLGRICTFNQKMPAGS